MPIEYLSSSSHDPLTTFCEKIAFWALAALLLDFEDDEPGTTKLPVER